MSVHFRKCTLSTQMSECFIHIELVGSTVTLTRIRLSFKIKLHISVLKEEQWDVYFQNASEYLTPYTLHAVFLHY